MINAVIRWCLKNGFLVFLALGTLLWGGYYAVTRTPVDAIPDIGEKQVIVYADWEGRSPQDVDNQITYPLTTSLTGTPGVKTIRSMSGFGFSTLSLKMTNTIEKPKPDMERIVFTPGVPVRLVVSGYVI